MEPLSPDPADEAAFFPAFAPVPLLRRRRGGWTPARQRMFVALLAETGSVKLAAQAVGMSARSAYQLREKPGADEFDAAWEDALEIGEQATRERLLERWRDGEKVPVVRRGRIVCYRHRRNDNALIAVLISGRRELARHRADAEERAYRRENAAYWREVERAEAEERRERERALAERRRDDARWLAEKTKPHRPRIQPL